MKPRPTPPLSNPRPRIGRVAALLTLCLATLLAFGGHDSNAQGQIQVNAADPALAAQGTVNLNVRITGKGFKNGAKAKWLVTGTTDPGGVSVNSTTFVSSSELSANITVADTATVSNFDIQVQNSDGRGGKGTELFAVTPSGGSCGTDVTRLSIGVYKYLDATNTTTYNLQPDLTNADGSPVPYLSGKSKGQTIDGRIQISNCTYDLTLRLNFSNRFMVYKFPNGSPLGTSVNAIGFNIDRVGSVPISDGGTDFLNYCNTGADNYGGCGVDAEGYFVRRSYGSSLDLGGNSNYGLRFNYSPFDNVNVGLGDTAFVKIYHPNANTWILRPEQVLPPAALSGTGATEGEWAAIIDRNFSPPTIVGYQKVNFRIVVSKF